MAIAALTIMSIRQRKRVTSRPNGERDGQRLYTDARKRFPVSGEVEAADTDLVIGTASTPRRNTRNRIGLRFSQAAARGTSKAVHERVEPSPGPGAGRGDVRKIGGMMRNAAMLCRKSFTQNRAAGPRRDGVESRGAVVVSPLFFCRRAEHGNATEVSGDGLRCNFNALHPFLCSDRSAGADRRRARPDSGARGPSGRGAAADLELFRLRRAQLYLRAERAKASERTSSAKRRADLCSRAQFVYDG